MQREAFNEYASRNDQLVYSDPVTTEKCRASFQDGWEARVAVPVSLEKCAKAACAYMNESFVRYRVSKGEDLAKAVLEAAAVSYE